MARVRGTILTGRSGRRGYSRQYHLGHGKGPGRRMSTKFLVPEPFPYQLPRDSMTPPPKTKVGQGEQIQALKEQAMTLEALLCYLEKRIRDIEPSSALSILTAFADPDRCIGCGNCQDVCPTRAISVEDIAEIDPKRCIGCGHCVDQCPRGALVLHPSNTGHKEKVCVTL